MSTAETLATVIGGDYALTAVLGFGVYAIRELAPRVRVSVTAAPQAVRDTSPATETAGPSRTPQRPAQAGYEDNLRRFTEHRGNQVSVETAGDLVGVRPRTAREYEAERKRRAAA